MVAVNAVGQTASPTAEVKSRTTLDHEAFLRLFVEQLKHQDPTSPMDASESLAQLATFSQVEQSVATNKKLDSLLAAQSLSQAGGLIGRTVTSADGAISGKVVSVLATDGGAMATLDDGRKLLVGAGVSVS